MAYLKPLKRLARAVLPPVLRRTLPLGVRRRVAVWTGRQDWLPGRSWWQFALLRDWSDQDPNTFHRFLWSHHLAYAETYKLERFRREHLNGTRRLLLADLQTQLAARRFGAVRSVFDVGCSLGYLLRFIETDVFPDARVLTGLDIDAHAIEAGRQHLKRERSVITLIRGDMLDLEQLLGVERFDVFVCAGVLMYLEEEAAAQVVETMLRHANQMVAMAGLADPGMDNALLNRSAIRTTDGTFIHNLDAMVQRGGGRIAFRRWHGAKMLDGNTVYFIFAVPWGE